MTLATKRALTTTISVFPCFQPTPLFLPHSPSIESWACLSSESSTAPSHEYSASSTACHFAPNHPCLDSSSHQQMITFLSILTLEQKACKYLHSLLCLWTYRDCPTPSSQRYCHGVPSLGQSLGSQVTLSGSLPNLNQFLHCKGPDWPQFCLTVKFIHPTKYFCAIHQNVQMSNITSKYSSLWVLFLRLE